MVAAGEGVHRPFACALVDEADSLLIDEARVPLVIAGHAARETSQAPRLAALVGALVARVHFATDEYARDVELTDAGFERVEAALGAGSLHAPGNETLLSEINCALHAQVLLRRDVDYIVRDGRIQIVDEFTGRVMSDRHWPNGLQAALEAKEGLDRRPDGRTLASMTLQRYLGGYARLCGMTGTGRAAAEELRTFYGLEVVVIPTHRPLQRIDQPDIVFTHREAKERAVVEEAARAHATGRPVLVGTLTVEESERLGAALRARSVPCEVLNAKHDEQEARIVAGAGAERAVTIATNMAGRGTDIRLGDDGPGSAERVAAAGGLYVLGTSRHESRRVDLQLRGRAGRQGDPGESRFFLSLEDELLVRYGLRRLIPQGALPPHGPAPIDDPIVRREIARAQRIIEGQEFEIRRTLGQYAASLEDQYAWVIERRHGLLTGEEVPDVWARDEAKRARLVAAVGEEVTCEAERIVSCAHLDRLWRAHLAVCADLREGIHLVRLGGQDPLERFTREVRTAFARLDEALDAAVLASLDQVRAADGRVDLGDIDVKGPSSTWTYLVNDDPFRDQVTLALLGAGGQGMAIYAAAFLTPLFALWMLVDRLVRRRKAGRQVGR